MLFSILSASAEDALHRKTRRTAALLIIHKTAHQSHPSGARRTSEHAPTIFGQTQWSQLQALSLALPIAPLTICACIMTQCWNVANVEVGSSLLKLEMIFLPVVSELHPSAMHAPQVIKVGGCPDGQVCC